MVKCEADFDPCDNNAVVSYDGDNFCKSCAVITLGSWIESEYFFGTITMTKIDNKGNIL